MERFIPTEIFRKKKSNMFQGITFFSVLPLRPFVRVAKTRLQRESSKVVQPKHEILAAMLFVPRLFRHS